MRARSRLPSLFGAGLALGLTLAGAIAHAAQAQTGTIRVEVVDEMKPIAGASVSAGRASADTDASGVATLTLPAGHVSVTATKDGYEPATALVDVVAGSERGVRLVLTATSTGRAVVGRDAIEQTLLMTPGNIVRLFDAMSGLRVQTTSPELGTAMVRTHGLPGQYTRLLSDGVPLYFDHPGGLALVQIPPMDVDRIEVIKGSASAIFGENAMGGVVNVRSRRPGKEREREFLLSQSTRDTTDAVLWISLPPRGPSGTWSSTWLVSAHKQNQLDVNDDGWSDVPRYSRAVVHPRVFWENGRGRAAWGTANVTFETREGGSTIAHQSLETRGADGTLSGHMPFGRFVLAGTSSLFVQSRTRKFGERREHERREAATFEMELRGEAPRQTWVAGLATDWYALRTRDTVPSAYSSTRASLFVHDEVDVAPWLRVSGSARVDHDILYGFFLSPRGSVRVRGGPWAAGLSAGRSYFGPLPITEETEAAGFARLSYAGPLHVETAHSVSGDLGYRARAVAVMFAVFQSHIDHPALVDRATYTFRTDAEPVVTHGVEILARVRRAPFTATGAYTYVEARERGDFDIALTPRHTAGLVAAVEAAGRGRVGVRVNYTDAQRLDANPYRSTSEPYVTLGLFAEYRVGRWRVFVNAENLTDVRQTDWDPIARPAPDVDGRWTVDAWAPLEGRVINVSIRIPF